MAVTLGSITPNGRLVMVNGAPFGWMRRPEGFRTDASTVIHLLPVSSSDLRAIADLSDEFCSGPVDLTDRSLIAVP